MLASSPLTNAAQSRQGHSEIELRFLSSKTGEPHPQATQESHVLTSFVPVEDPMSGFGARANVKLCGNLVGVLIWLDTRHTTATLSRLWELWVYDWAKGELIMVRSFSVVVQL